MVPYVRSEGGYWLTKKGKDRWREGLASWRNCWALHGDFLHVMMGCVY